MNRSTGLVRVLSLGIALGLGGIAGARELQSASLATSVEPANVEPGTDEPERFLRGDVNGDQQVNLRDIRSFAATLGAAYQPPCIEALDYDGDQLITMLDFIRPVRWLYLGRDMPPSGAFPACDFNAPNDNLTCNIDTCVP